MKNNHDIALKLYDSQVGDDVFKNVFTEDELVDLWTNHCVYKVDDNSKVISPDAPYDDEVYNALERYGYWDNK